MLALKVQRSRTVCHFGSTLAAVSVIREVRVAQRCLCRVDAVASSPVQVTRSLAASRVMSSALAGDDANDGLTRPEWT